MLLNNSNYTRQNLGLTVIIKLVHSKYLTNDVGIVLPEDEVEVSEPPGGEDARRGAWARYDESKGLVMAIRELRISGVRGVVEFSP